jgi:hypothetical protein
MNVAHADGGAVLEARVSLREPAGPGGQGETARPAVARPLGIWPLVNAVPADLRGRGAGSGGGVPVSPGDLGRLVHSIAAEAGHWESTVRFDPMQRWYQRLALTGHLEVWLLSWLPGQSTGFHDHGEAVGAFTVAQGELTERTVPRGQVTAASRIFPAGLARPFGAAHTHDVVNLSAAPAVSVHAYSPPLTAMRRFELTSGGLVHTGTESAEEGW